MEVSTKFLMVFGFGMIIVFLYAREKFNVPTYDKDLSGPFAQLPPQFLTMDSRYRLGRRVYLALMLALYTAVSLVGPSIITVDPTIRGLIPKEFQDAKELWPVAAATFLVYTGAAKDTSVIGRIELAIRQYAHKKAYIPDAVYGLATSLRNIDIARWLGTDPSVDEKEREERRAALATLITSECLNKLERDRDQEGELATWARANILFHAFTQLFDDRRQVVDVRLDHLIESPENKASRERLQTERDRLTGVYKCSPETNAPTSEKIFADIQRFLRDVSVTLAVLLSQAARNSNDLVDRLEQLGFHGLQDRDRSDHTLFATGVSVAIIAGAFLAGLMLVLSHQTWVLPDQFWKPVDGWQIGYFKGFITIAIAVMIYIVSFRAIDYQRDRLIDTLDWSEDLEGYAQTVVPASVVATLVCLVAVILLMFALNSLTDVISGVTGLIQQILHQFLLAFLASVFFVVYMRQAAKLRSDQTSLRTQLLSGSPFLHASIAALLAGLFSLAADSFEKHDTPKKYHVAAQTSFDAVAPAMWNRQAKTWFAGKYTTDQVAEIRKNLAGISPVAEGPDVPKALDAETTKVKEICTKLNEPLPNAAAAGSGTSELASESKPQQKLFSGECTLSDSAPQETPEEKEFAGLASKLGALVVNLNKLKDYRDKAKGPRYYEFFVFPALVVFIVTYAFGVGCRSSRVWLLYKDADRDDSLIVKFKEQLKKLHGDNINADKCLISPLGALDYLTPLEALRYPDYRAKLFAKLQKKKIIWPKECSGSKPAVQVQGEVPPGCPSGLNGR